MGYWGTGIFDGDLPQEIYQDFFDEYNQKVPVDEILQNLKSQYLDSGAVEDKSIFWFSVAYALWETGSLTPEVLKEVDACIASQEGDLEQWAASGGDVKKRAAAIKKFYQKITTGNLKPKAPKLPRKRIPLFVQGEVYAYKLFDNHYSGFYVLGADEKSGRNDLIPLDLYTPYLPSLEEALLSKILFRIKSRFQDGTVTEYSTIRDTLGTLTFFAFNREHKSFAKKCHLLGTSQLQKDRLYLKNFPYSIYLSGGLFPAPLEESIVQAIKDFRESPLSQESVPLYASMGRDMPAPVIKVQ